MVSSLSGEKVAGLAASLDAAQVKQSSSEPIWAYANMVKISSVYKTQISDGLDVMKKQAVAPNSPAFIAGFMNAFAGYAKDFMQQSKSVTLSCNPKPAVLNFRVGLDALPGTEMAGMFVADGAAKDNPLLGYTEDGAAMNLVGRINHSAFKKLNAKCVDLMVIMAGMDANDPNIVKTKKLLDDCADSIGDFVVCSFKIDLNVKPLFDAKYVLEVKDANRFNKVSDEFVKLWTGSAFNDLYKSMGIETGFIVKRGAENYKGVSIDVAKLSMKFTDTNSPEAKMLEAMYGSGFEYRWAIVNGLWVCRISADPNAIYKLIDQVKAGSPAQACSEMQKAMSIIPDADSKNAVVTYNYLRLMKAMQGFAQMPFTMPDVPSKSNLVFATKIDNGSFALDFALPKEHLSEMMTAFQMIMQQQMQTKPGQPNQQGMPKQPSRQMPPDQPNQTVLPALHNKLPESKHDFNSPSPTGRAVVVFEPPRVMIPWESSRYRWDATFRETGGKSGFKVKATDFYVLSTNGTKWTNSWGPSVEVKAGGSADVDWWVDESEKWAGGKFHCIWVGQDDTGVSIRVEQWADIP
jgi:hypothetical protein